LKAILDNIWVKRCVAVFGCAYFAVLCLLTVATFLYKLEFVEGMQAPFFLLFGIASVFFLVLMLYTRELLITKIVSILMMLVTFCLIILNMFQWVLIIPPFIVSLVIFFAAGTRANVKVIMGTIYLLVYVLGIVAYFVLNMLLGGSAVETRLNIDLDQSGEVYQLYSGQMRKLSEVTDRVNTISPDGEYEFYFVDVQDSDKGCVKIYVVPANDDIELKFFTLKQQGIKKTVTKNGTRGIVPSAGWIVEQDEVTGETYLAILYQLTDEELPKTVKVRNLPKKNYFGFLGIQ